MVKKSMSKLGSIHFRIDEDDWLSDVRDCLRNSSAEVEQELDEILHRRPTICKVQKDMAAANSAAFTPQCISLGPYHRGRADLYAMERYKLAAARRFYSSAVLQTGGLSFEEAVIHNMTKRERCLRNCYETFIDCRAETLAWLVTLDAIFLLDCLQLYARGQSAVFNSVKKDMIKLENQIPLFALENLLRLQLGEKALEKLANLLVKALAVFSPIEPLSMDAAAKKQLPASAHLLDALYFTLVPCVSRVSQEQPQQEEEEEPVAVEEPQQEQEQRQAEECKEEVKQALSLLWKLLSSLKVKPVQQAVDALTKVSSASFKIVGSLGSLRILRTLTGGSGSTATSSDDAEEDTAMADKSVAIEIPPTRDELAVPSVTELKKSGVRFKVAPEGGIRGVRFDAKSGTLYLPAMRCSGHTEVVFRNLIAYEASVATSSGRAMEFTRFVDFINGIVDTAQDVQILKKCGILRHHLQSDLEVANLCNGMGACVKLTRVDYLDAVIRDVNAFYHRTWSVKVMGAVNSYVFGSWKCLSFLAAVLLLALTCLQAFCSVDDCRKWLSHGALE